MVVVAAVLLVVIIVFVVVVGNSNRGNSAVLGFVSASLAGKEPVCVT